MKNRCFVRFLNIMIAVMILGVLSPTMANAGYPILKLDFSNKNDPAQTEPGFISFVAADSGSVVDGIKSRTRGHHRLRAGAAPHRNTLRADLSRLHLCPAGGNDGHVVGVGAE